MAEHDDGVRLASREWKWGAAVGLLALVLAISAISVGLVGYRGATDTIQSGCTLEDNDSVGRRLIGIAFWLLAPAALLSGLVAGVSRGPLWSRLAGALAMLAGFAVLAGLAVTYWNYTCSN